MNKVNSCSSKSHKSQSVLRKLFRNSLIAVVFHAAHFHIVVDIMDTSHSTGSRTTKILNHGKTTVTHCWLFIYLVMFQMKT